MLIVCPVVFPAKDYPPRMGILRIEVGDLHFSARWESAAPRTTEAIRRMLPIESRLIDGRVGYVRAAAVGA